MQQIRGIKAGYCFEVNKLCPSSKEAISRNVNLLAAVGQRYRVGYDDRSLDIFPICRKQGL